MTSRSSPFFKHLRDEVLGNRIALVVGAGVSLQATNGNRLASWHGLLENGIERCRAVCQDIDEAWQLRRLDDLKSARDSDDLLAVGTQVERKLKRQAGHYARWLADVFGQLEPSNGELLSIIGQLSRVILTTNYDTLLETETHRNGVAWLDRNAVLRVLRGEDDRIVHLHGLWSQPETVVLGDSSYASILSDTLAQDHQRIFAATRTLLFVGYGLGMSDPNFSALLRWMGTFFRDANVVHYQLVREEDVEKARLQLPADGHIQALSYGHEYAELASCLRSLLPEVVAVSADPARALTSSRAKLVPELPPLPTLDPQGPYVSSFIGREIVLGAFEDALKGLLEDSRGDLISSRAGHVRLLWVYGYGGMGKSWFLRRVCTRARDQNVQIAFIDWDDDEWRSPLAGRPTLAEHVLECLATRLTQLYGEDLLLPYWSARGSVRLLADQHTSLAFDFSSWVRLLSDHGSEWRTSDEARRREIEGNTKALKQIFLLEELLKTRGLLHRDAAIRRRKLDEICQSTSQQRQIFEAWAAQALGADASNELISPIQVMADALRLCVRQVCNKTPLLLVLDTCEVLSDDLSRWLRHVLAPPLADHESMLVVVGSRSWLDADLESGNRDGWRDRVPQERIRQEVFDKTVALTVDEVQRLLHLGCSPEVDTYDAAAYMHRITRGVPLALRVAMESIDGDLRRLSEIAVDDTVDDGLDSDDELTRKVIETMSGRFLLHLENRPEAEEDFRDVMAIGILWHPSAEVLRQYWGTENASNRIRELNRRYSLFSGADLHETIRDYVRRTWRQSPPPNLSKVAHELHQAFQATLLDAEETADELRLLEEVNLVTWVEKSTPWGYLACAGIRLLALRSSTATYEEEFVEILSELRPDTNRNRALRDKLIDAFRESQWGNSMALQTLSGMASPALTGKDQGLIAMLLGLAYGQDEKYEEAVEQFEIMTNRLGEDVSNVVQVSRHYLGGAIQCMVKSSDQNALEQSLDWVLQFADPDEDLFLVGAAQLLLNRLDEAEQTLIRASDRDIHDDGAIHQLAHVYEAQEKFDDADRAFSEAIRRNDREQDNWLCWGKHWKKRQNFPKAAEKFRVAAEQWPASSRAWSDLAVVLKRGDANSKEARDAFSKAVALMSQNSANDDAETMNSIAWDLFELRHDLPLAETMVKRALKKQPEQLNTLHTLACILLGQNKWVEVRPILADLIRRQNPDKPVLERTNLLQTVADAVVIGGDAIFAALEQPQWKLMKEAAEQRLSAGDGELMTVGTENLEQVERIAEEMDKFAIVPRGLKIS